MLTTLVSFLVASLALASLPQSSQSDPSVLFRQLGLDQEQIEAIDKGQPVAKVLSWGGSSEVHVFGAVHINGSSEGKKLISG